MTEKITLKKVKCTSDSGVETECFELKCQSCGESPILVEVEELLANGCYVCPSCGVFSANQFEEA